MPHNGQPVSVRIGLHTGPCVSGLVGTKVRILPIDSTSASRYAFCHIHVIEPSPLHMNVHTCLTPGAQVFHLW